MTSPQINVTKRTRSKAKPAPVARAAKRRPANGKPAAKVVPESTVIEMFMNTFNAALDTLNVPPLHYGRQKWIAEKYNVSTSAARKWMSGDCMPDWDNMLLIADDLGMTVDQLLGRKPITGNEMAIAIPIRSDAEDADSTFGSVAFEAGVLETALRMRQNGVELFVVSTDSMAPTINIGDIAFIDTQVQKLEDNKIYMFSVVASNRVLIRRALLNLDGTVRLLSSNGNYPEVQLQSKDIHVGTGAVKKNCTLKLKGEINWTIKKVTGAMTPTFERRTQTQARPGGRG